MTFAQYACVNFWRATLDCRCYGQHSHENESRTEIRREQFKRAVVVLDKTFSYKWYSSRLIFPRINGPNLIWPRIRFDISLQNFKKPLDIFSPQIERKRSKEHLVIILAVKESFERFSCLEFIFVKSNTGKPA